VIVYQAIMVNVLVEGECPYLNGDNGVVCSPQRGLFVARDYVRGQLDEPGVSVVQVRDLLCNIGGRDCPVRNSLVEFQARSPYAKQF